MTNEDIFLPALGKFIKDLLKFFVPFVLVVGISTTGFYTIQPDEEGVVLRFGKILKTSGPGLHFKIPFGVDHVFKVKVTQIRTEKFGSNDNNNRFSNIENQEEGLTLTGDLNIADVQWIVQYRIKDPVLYLFQVSDVRKTIRNVSETVMREQAGDRSIDEVINIGRRDIELVSKEKMQKILDSYKIGISITRVNLQNVTPPQKVAPAFNEVNEANQEKEKMINEALAEYNKTIPRVEGEAQQLISQAEGYAIDKVNRSQGDVAKFVALVEEYKKAKDITKMRLYLETMSKVYQRVDKVIVDENLPSLLPILPLNSETSNK